MARKPNHPVETGGIVFNTTSTTSGILDAEYNEYRLIASADCWLYLDSGGRDVASGLDVLLPANTELRFDTTGNRNVLGVLGDSGDGTLSWTKLGS